MRVREDVSTKDGTWQLITGWRCSRSTRRDISDNAAVMGHFY